MIKEYLSDRVRLTLYDGDKKLVREIPLIRIEAAKFDLLKAEENKMYEDIKKP